MEDIAEIYGWTVSAFEGGEGFEEGKIYIDPLYDIPTVGYGFALSLARAPNMSLRADLDAALVDAGISWTTAQKDFIEDLMGDINAGNVSQAQSDLSTAYDTGQIFHGGEINETEYEESILEQLGDDLPEGEIKIQLDDGSGSLKEIIIKYK